MAQTIQLTSSEKLLSRVPAQVIALDPRPRDAAQSDKKHLRILQISDLLSRNLEIAQVIEAFMSEIAAEINYCGFQFKCEDIDTCIEHGVIAGFDARYRLKMQNRLLGELPCSSAPVLIAMNFANLKI